MNVVITTAAIPGRPAPKLISAAMVKSMKPGSVIVDLAVETGGNCEVTEAGKVVVKHGVKIVGHLNVPGRLAADASMLYANNLFNFVALLYDKESKELAIDWEDEIVQGTLVTRDGAIVHPDLKPSEAAPAPVPAAPPAAPPATKVEPESMPESRVEMSDKDAAEDTAESAGAQSAGAESAGAQSTGAESDGAESDGAEEAKSDG